MRKTVVLTAFLAIASFASVGHAAPPKASSLRDAWQSIEGKCGTLVENEELYEFSLDNLNSQAGLQCVSAAGADVVLFEPNPAGAILGSPKQYLLVPMERIVLRVYQ